MPTNSADAASPTPLQTLDRIDDRFEDEGPPPPPPPPPPHVPDGEGEGSGMTFIQSQQNIYSYGTATNVGNAYRASTVYNVNYTFRGGLEIVRPTNAITGQQAQFAITQDPASEHPTPSSGIPAQLDADGRQLWGEAYRGAEVESSQMQLFRPDSITPSTSTDNATPVHSDVTSSSTSAMESSSSFGDMDSRRAKASEFTPDPRYEFNMTCAPHEGNISDWQNAKPKASKSKDVLAQANIPRNLFHPPPSLLQIEEYTALLAVHPDCLSLIALWSPSRVLQSTYIRPPANTPPLPLGNVGFLTPDGHFEDLFNVFLTQQENEERGYVVPSGFEPWKGIATLEHVNTRRRDLTPFRPGLAISRSSGSVVIQRGETTNSEQHGYPRNYICKLSKDPSDSKDDTELAGAAVILPQGAGHVQLSFDTTVSLTARYLNREFVKWLPYCHAQRDGRTKDGTVMVVTEACFTQSWAAMSYAEPVTPTSRRRPNPKDFDLPAIPVDKDGRFYRWDEHTPPGSMTKTERNVFDTPQDAAREGLCIAVGGYLLKYERHRKSTTWQRTKPSVLKRPESIPSNKSSDSASTIIGKRLASLIFFGKPKSKKSD